ncbi:MAG: hypothetical protein ACR2LM_00710 [Pyrinomonadaceae bacterium]
MFRNTFFHCGIAIVSIATVLVGGPGWAGIAGDLYANRRGHGSARKGGSETKKAN